MDMEKALQEDPMVIKVVAKNYVQADKVDAFIALAKQLVEETNKEAGCLFYQLHQSVNDPTVLAFIEEWESKEALDAHMASAHFQDIVPRLREFSAKPGDGTLFKQV